MNNIQVNGSFWTDSEFEEALIRGLISYEEPKAKWMNSGYKNKIITPADFKELKEFGLYIPHGDRIIQPEHVDFKNDGFLTKGSLGLIQNPKDGGNYFSGVYIKALHKCPSFIKKYFIGTVYQIIFYLAQNHGSLYGGKLYAGIDTQGNVKPCFMIEQNGQVHCIDKSLNMNTGKETDGASAQFMLGGTYWAFTDRKYFWNVEADGGKGKIIFGVREDQIKSLFYARDLPITDTGRKRPILHWVQAHKRRIKSGTNININEHLRGMHIFEMGGTNFKITQPVKQPSVKNIAC